MRRTLLSGALAALLLGGASAPPASAQYFGKNKVQYKDLRWEVLETEHFDVYHYVGIEEAAFDAARMAERSYRRLSYLLRHDVRDRIPLILYASHADFQATNISPELIGEGTGGVTEFLKRRVYLPFTGSYAELEHVLTHELVHAFQVDILWGGDQRSLLSNPFAFQPPLWVMEGSAEYLSRGGVDPNTEMWLRDGALQGYLTPIPVLSQVYDIRIYRYGQSIFEYVGRRFGPEKVGEILKRIGAGRNVEGAFRRVTGLTLEKLSEDWTEEVRRTYLPQVAEYQKPESFARRITDSERSRSGYNVSPAVSPQGDKVVFVSDRDLTSSLYLASTLDGKNLGRLVAGERTGDLESLRFFYSSADWSPDGRLIAFPAKAGARDEINLFDAVERRRVRRIRFEELDGIRSPSWSPDGRQLVFAGFVGGRSDLFLCDADGSNLRRLTEDRYSALEPRWSPDGRTILFTSDRGPDTDHEALRFGPQRLTLYHLETGRIEVLPNQTGKSLSPHFSPDGRKIIYVGDRDGVSNLYRLDLDTGRHAQLTRILTGVSGITEESPPLSISRDGKRLVFSAFSRGSWDLFTLKDPFEMAARDTAGEVAVASSEVARRATGLAELTQDVLTRDRDGEAPGSPAGGAAGDPDSLITVLARPDRSPPDGDPGPFPTAHGPTGPPGPPAPEDSTLAPPGGAPFVPLRDPAGGGPPANTDSLLARLDALPDSAEIRRTEYKKRFSADYGTAAAAVGGGLGIAGQALVSFSDILGDHQILVGASIYGSLTDADLLLQYTNLARRTNWGIAAYQFRSDFLLSTMSTQDEYQSNIYRGVDLVLSRPFDRFDRIEIGAAAATVTERIYRFDDPFADYEDTRVDLGTRGYVSPSIALVRDTALYGSTGPIRGTRARLEARQAVGGLSFTDLSADLRRYVNIGQRYSLAGRAIGVTSLGEDPQIRRVGGPFTNRGVDYGELEGSNILVTNLEFRFPFIDYLDIAFPLPLRLGGLRGALFFDAAAAWGETYLIEELPPEEQAAQRAFTPFSSVGGLHFDDLRGAYGFGFRLNLGFLLARWDLARPTDLKRNLGDWKGYFTLGGEF